MASMMEIHDSIPIGSMGPWYVYTTMDGIILR